MAEIKLFSYCMLLMQSYSCKLQKSVPFVKSQIFYWKWIEKNYGSSFLCWNASSLNQHSRKSYKVYIFSLYDIERKFNYHLKNSLKQAFDRLWYCNHFKSHCIYIINNNRFMNHTTFLTFFLPVGGHD